MNGLTIEEFLQELSKYKGQFKQVNVGKIRAFNGLCPISFLAKIKKKSYTYWKSAALELGLSEADAKLIAESADYVGPLREKLEEVCL